MSKKPMPDVHPYAAFFPLDEGPNLWELANDIKENGLLEPIWLLGGMILDGRRRHLGCERAGVEPSYQEYHGDDPLGFVVSKNLHRRHLGTGDRSLIAAKIAGMKQGGTEKHPSAPKGAIRDNSVSQEKAAELLNVSRNSVQRASQVLESGTPELIAAVTAGEVTVTDAAAIVKEPAKVQNAAVKAKKSGKTKTVKAAVPPPPDFDDMPDPLPVVPVDAFGTEIPKRCRDAYCDPWIQNAIDLIAKTEQVFREGRLIDGMEKRKKHYPFFEPKEFIDGCGFVMTYLDQLLNHLKDFRPAGVCPACAGESCAHCKMKGIVPRHLYGELKKKVKT